MKGCRGQISVGAKMSAGTKSMVAKEGANYLWGSTVRGDQMYRDQKLVDPTLYQIQTSTMSYSFSPNDFFNILSAQKSPEL